MRTDPQPTRPWALVFGNNQGANLRRQITQLRAVGAPNTKQVTIQQEDPVFAQEGRRSARQADRGYLVADCQSSIATCLRLGSRAFKPGDFGFRRGSERRQALVLLVAVVCYGVAQQAPPSPTQASCRPASARINFYGLPSVETVTQSTSGSPESLAPYL